jgi:hypothetical protein
MAPLPARGIPAVTNAMKRAGAEILASAVEMPAEELVTLIYEAMALELDVDGVGDRPLTFKARIGRSELRTCRNLAGCLPAAYPRPVASKPVCPNVLI